MSETNKQRKQLADRVRRLAARFERIAERQADDDVKVGTLAAEAEAAKLFRDAWQADLLHLPGVEIDAATLAEPTSLEFELREFAERSWWSIGLRCLSTSANPLCVKTVKRSEGVVLSAGPSSHRIKASRNAEACRALAELIEANEPAGNEPASEAWIEVSVSDFKQTRQTIADWCDEGTKPGIRRTLKAGKANRYLYFVQVQYAAEYLKAEAWRKLKTSSQMSSLSSL